MGTMAILITLVVVVCTFVVALKFPAEAKIKKEPPFISSKVPYIGHLIGLFWHKNHYYTKLR